MWSEEELEREVNHLLNKLGVTANYRGYYYVNSAIELCVEKEERLLLITKWLYPEVAKRYQTNWKAVERSMRTAGGIMWRENQPFLEELACRKLEKQPRTAQVLSILVSAVKKEGPRAECSQPRQERGMEEVKQDYAH